MPKIKQQAENKSVAGVRRRISILDPAQKLIMEIVCSLTDVRQYNMYNFVLKSVLFIFIMLLSCWPC